MTVFMIRHAAAIFIIELFATLFIDFASGFIAPLRRRHAMNIFAFDWPRQFSLIYASQLLSPPFSKRAIACILYSRRFRHYAPRYAAFAASIAASVTIPDDAITPRQIFDAAFMLRIRLIMLF